MSYSCHFLTNIQLHRRRLLREHVNGFQKNEHDTSKFRYYGPSQVFQCGTLQYNLSSWQELWRSKGIPEGGEYGSKIVEAMPTTAEIVAMAQERV